MIDKINNWLLHALLIDYRSLQVYTFANVLIR